jgi:hypothetical protein
MNSSVGLAPNVFVTTFTDKNSYCPPDNITITTQLENKGNFGTTGNLFVHVSNPFGVDFKDQNWYGISLNPADIKEFYLSHIVTGSEIAGVYTGRSNFTYNSKEVYDETSFRIKYGFGSLIASPSQIEETVFPNDVIVKYIYFWLMYPCYGTYVQLNASSGPPGSWVVFTSNPVWLSPETWNVTKVMIFIDLPWNTIPGDYIGSIQASIGEETQLNIPIIIHVQTQAIFDITTEVLSEYKEVCRGSDVTARTFVLKVFPPETFDIDLTYRIETNNTMHDETKERVAISDTLERYKSLTVPSDAPLGVYTFYSILNSTGTNWTTSGVSYDIFTVKECLPSPPPPTPSAGPTGREEIFPLTSKGLLLNVSRYKILTTLGNTTSFLAWVKNTKEGEIKDVKVSVDGVPKEWLTIYPYKIDLKSGESEEFLVLIKIPENAEEKIYKLNIKATDSVTSNEESLILIVGKDEESLTRLLLEELEGVRLIANRTLQLKCLDIKEMISLFEEGERIRGLGLEEMNAKNYKKTQELFIQAITTYENDITKANVLMDIRLGKIKPFSFFPFSGKIKLSLEILEKNTYDRNYTEFCKSLKDVLRYSLYSILIITFSILIIIAIVVLLIYIYRRRKELDVYMRIRKIRERLKDVTGSRQ